MFNLVQLFVASTTTTVVHHTRVGCLRNFLHAPAKALDLELAHELVPCDDCSNKRNRTEYGFLFLELVVN